jgi:very-short-patch-repair endonuclease
MNYKDMTESDKKDLITKEYEIHKKSFQEIAQLFGTYANKIRRDAIKFGIKVRDKSEAQKNALDNGKTQHPTKGKQRPSSVKQKIGLSVLESWQNLDDNELQQRKDKARINWNNKSDEEKENILKQANTAVREAGKTGSKLEKFLLKQLLSNGYSVEFHKEQSILNTKLQIDLFIPKLNVAIEVDGPSHFEPVWGDDTLKRNKKYDDKKTGLIIGKGLYLVRIKQTKDFSSARGLIIFDQLVKLLQDISEQKPTNTKVLYIGD